jgi:hypothetical protein
MWYALPRYIQQGNWPKLMFHRLNSEGTTNKTWKTVRSFRQLVLQTSSFNMHKVLWYRQHTMLSLQLTRKLDVGYFFVLGAVAVWMTFIKWVPLRNNSLVLATHLHFHRSEPQFHRSTFVNGDENRTSRVSSPEARHQAGVAGKTFPWTTINQKENENEGTWVHRIWSPSYIQQSWVTV